MFRKIAKVLEGGKFELSSVLQKIEKLWIQGQITDTQRDRLYEMARENADPQRSLLPLEKQFEEISLILKDLSVRIQAIEKELSLDPTQAVRDFVPYKRPSRDIDCYCEGDKVLWKNKKYVCVERKVVWSPDDYPKGWKLVE